MENSVKIYKGEISIVDNQIIIKDRVKINKIISFVGVFLLSILFFVDHKYILDFREIIRTSILSVLLIAILIKTILVNTQKTINVNDIENILIKKRNFFNNKYRVFFYLKGKQKRVIFLGNFMEYAVNFEEFLKNNNINYHY